MSTGTGGDSPEAVLAKLRREIGEANASAPEGVADGAPVTSPAPVPAEPPAAATGPGGRIQRDTSALAEFRRGLFSDVLDRANAWQERAEAAEARLNLIATHLPVTLDALTARIADERWEAQRTPLRDARAALRAALAGITGKDAGDD